MADINEIQQNNRERESKAAIDALQMSDEDILKEIFICSNDHFSHTQSTRVSRSLANFSALLINLSRKAEASTKENIIMQRKITRLTWGLFWLTVALLVLTLFQVAPNIKSIPEINKSHAESKQAENT